MKKFFATVLFLFMTASVLQACSEIPNEQGSDTEAITSLFQEDDFSPVYSYHAQMLDDPADKYDLMIARENSVSRRGEIRIVPWNRYIAIEGDMGFRCGQVVEDEAWLIRPNSGWCSSIRIEKFTKDKTGDMALDIKLPQSLQISNIFCDFSVPGHAYVDVYEAILDTQTKTSYGVLAYQLHSINNGETWEILTFENAPTGPYYLSTPEISKHIDAKTAIVCFDNGHIEDINPLAPRIFITCNSGQTWQNANTVIVPAGLESYRADVEYLEHVNGGYRMLVRYCHNAVGEDFTSQDVYYFSTDLINWKIEE